jgi:hypothetical protein
LRAIGVRVTVTAMADEVERADQQFVEQERGGGRRRPVDGSD